MFRRPNRLVLVHQGKVHLSISATVTHPDPGEVSDGGSEGKAMADFSIIVGSSWLQLIQQVRPRLHQLYPLRPVRCSIVCSPNGIPVLVG